MTDIIRETGLKYRNWGKWGKDDELGTLNYITPDAIVKAAGLVKRGQVFSLAIPFDKEGPQINQPRRFNPIHRMILTGPDFTTGAFKRPGNVGFADDMIIMALQCGTQWDALSHCFKDGQLYNGYDANLVSSEGAKKNGIHKMARGVVAPPSPPTRGAWRCGPTRFPTATSPCTRSSSPTWACWSARSSRSTSWPKTARGTASSSSSSWRRRCRSPAPSARRSTRSRSNERADLGFEEPPRGRPQFGLPAPVEGVAQPAAEAGHVGPVEDEPALGEPGLELAIEALRVLALPRHVDGHVALDDRLNVGRQPAPEPSIGQHVEARPHVVGDGHVARDLVETIHLGHDEGIFLALHAVGFQRVVELGDGDVDRDGAQRLEEVGEHPAARDAHGHADEIVGALDGTLDRGDLAEAVLHQTAGQTVQTSGPELLLEKRTELSVHHAVDLLGAREGEGQALDFHHGRDLTEDPAHLREELELARDQHLEHGGIGARHSRVPSVHAAVEAPGRLVTHRLPEIHQERMLVALLRLVVELPSAPDGGHRTFYTPTPLGMMPSQARVRVA